MITLEPTVDELPEMVRVLVDLADSVYDVATTTDTPRLGLVIPDDLYARYRRYLELDYESSPPIEPKKRSKK
jgi:hypothetical protein